MGTSLAVHPFAGLVNEVPRGTPRLLVNRDRVGSFHAPTDGFYQGDPYSAQMGGGTRPAINGGGYSADFRNRGMGGASSGRGGGWGGQTSLGGGRGYDYGGGRYGYGSGEGGRYADVRGGTPHGMQYGRDVY